MPPVNFTGGFYLMNFNLPKPIRTLLTLVLIAGIIYLRIQLGREVDVQNSNFAFFWLAGRMVLDGENPYDETQFLAGHETHGIEWVPNRIFPYPLPLALICVPLGLLSMQTAYTIWQITSLLIAALTVYVLLKKFQYGNVQNLFVPIFLFLTLFGPLYLTTLAGSVSALGLITVFGAILLLDQGRSLPAGILLALTMLKPPQGLTILLLAGVWFLAKRDWKAIIGVALGGIGLLVIGLIQDPQWLTKFLGASDAVMDRTQGVHSNVWAFSYLACGGSSPCSTLLGGTLSLILLGGTGYLLWKNQAKWSAWEAMNIILPSAFLSTIYLWAYDQLPYIIPIVWVVGMLATRPRGILFSIGFLVLLDLISFFALIQQANTEKDLWSLGTTLLLLVFLVIAQRMKPESAIDKAPASA